MHGELYYPEPVTGATIIKDIETENFFTEEAFKIYLLKDCKSFVMDKETKEITIYHAKLD